jgi:KaiC/GvpD/RAD55 family RecA-like ATPase
MSNSTEFTYDLSEVLGFEDVTSIRPGTSVLVSGPTMTGKDDLLFELLGAGVDRGEASIVVTTDRDGEETLDEITTYAERPDQSLLSGIDCRANSGREEHELDSGALLYSVSEPSEFTGIGIGITKSFERMDDDDVTTGRMALTSLSTMVRYADRKTVFKFCHVLSQRLDSAGFVGFFALNSGAHDDQTVQVIKQAFDANIEIREEGGERQARLLGIDARPTEWRTL